MPYMIRSFGINKMMIIRRILYGFVYLEVYGCLQSGYILIVVLSALSLWYSHTRDHALRSIADYNVLFAL